MPIKKGRIKIQQSDGSYKWINTTYDSTDIDVVRTIKPIESSNSIKTPKKEKSLLEYDEEIKENNFLAAKKDYQDKLTKEYKKNDIDFKTSFDSKKDKKISYNTKNIEQIEKNNNIKKYDLTDIRKNLKKESKNIEQKRNDLVLAEAKLNKEKVNNETTTLFDKTIGIIPRAIADLGSTFTLSEREYINDKGRKTYLPTYNELKQEKVREDYDSNIGRVLGDVGYNVSKIVGSSLIPKAGTALYFTDIFTDNYKNVINEGYDTKKAFLNSAVSAALEYTTGKIFGGATKKLTGGATNQFSKQASNTFNKLLNNPKVSNILGNATSEAVEEFAQEYLDNFNRLITLENETDLKKYKDTLFDKEILADALYSSGIGFLSGGTTESIDNSEGKLAKNNTKILETLKENIEIKKQKEKNKTKVKKYNDAINAIDNYIKKPFTTEFDTVYNQANKLAILPTGLNQNLNNDSNNIQGNPLIENSIQPMMPLDINTANKINNQNSILNQPTQVQNVDSDINILSNEKNASNVTNNSNISNNDVSLINENNTNYEYIPDSNIKIDNLRKSASQYLNNSNVSKSFIETAEKVINDKGYNIVLDDSLTSQNGNMVNAQIKNLENGEPEIRINPNSERAGELLLTHEITHAIETKDMTNLVLDFASKHKDFNDSLESLKQTYGTEDVSSEVLADISGQLFSNQEFINTLSMEKPNIFKRLYDSIISLANKLTGNSKESLFIKDLKNKWEKAYRNQNNNLEETRYMMTSLKGMEQGIKTSKKYQKIKDRYDAALWLENRINKSTDKKYTNEEIRKITGWFKDKEGNLEFEISDKNTKILDKLSPNTSYKLSEIFEAKTLYDLYPELKNVELQTKHMKNKGRFNKQENKISLNNKLLNNSELVRGIILHEIQHYIQNVEGLPTGTTILFGNERYANSKGEIEAADTNNRRNMTVEERKNIAPESSKENPVHPNREAILNHKRSIKEKISEKLYNILETKNQKSDNIVDNVIDKFYNEYGDDIYENIENYDEQIVEQIVQISKKDIREDRRETWNRLGNGRQYDVNKELEKSSFSFDEKAKRYDDLIKTDKIEYFTKDNGDIKIILLDSDSNLVNDFSSFSEKNTINLLGEGIGEYINKNSDNSNKTLYLKNNTINVDDITNKIYNSLNKEESIYEQEINRRRNGNVESRTIEREMGENVSKREYTKKEWNEFEQSAERNKTKTISNYQKQLQTKVKTKFDKELKYYNSAEKYFGGSSANDNKKIYVSSNLDEKIQKFVAYHEILESEIMHNKDLKNKYLQSAIETIMNDVGYKQTRKNFEQGQREDIKNVSDYLVAKDILCDYFAEQETGISKGYDFSLSNDTLEILQYSIERINETFNNENKKYSKETGSWQDFVEENFKSKGAKSYFKDMKLKGKITKDINKEFGNITTNNVPIDNIKLGNKVLEYKGPTKEASYDIKKTRKEVQQQLLHEMKITIDDIQVGSDIAALNFQITDPIRVNEKVFGEKMGKKINNATINKTKENTAKKTRWLNQEREQIKKLGIKARSKESAAVQKYAEKHYINKYGEKIGYDDRSLANEFPDVKVQEKIKEAAKFIRKKYDNYIDQINSVITQLGYDEIPKRENYMRHFKELNDKLSYFGIPFNLNDLAKEDLPTDINGLTEFNKPGKNWFASSMHRKGDKTNYDAITGIDGYLENASNLIFHTADIQRYRALSNMIRNTYGQTKGLENLENLSEAEYEQRIEDIQGNKLSKYVSWLDEQANSIAGKKGAIDRGTERFLGRKFYSLFNTLKSQVGSNMTGYNVRSSLTNFISTSLAAAKIEKISMAKGMVSTINNLFKHDDFINKSDFLTSRFGSDSLSRKMWQKVSNAGQVFMSGTDYFAANLIVRSKYFEGKSKKMTDIEAIKYADDFAARVLGDRSQGSTAEIFNSKTLGLLTQFQLEINNQWQYMIHDTKMDYYQNMEKGSKFNAGKQMLFQLGQIVIYSHIIDEIFKNVTGSSATFDPVEIIKAIFGLGDYEDEEKEKRLETARELFLNNIPFFGILTNGKIPIQEALPVRELIYEEDKYGNKKHRLATIAETLPYYVLPTGYSQLKKTIKGSSMYLNDKEIKGSYNKKGDLRFEVKKDPLSVTQNVLFGQYSSENARKYFNKGYAPIDKKTIEKLKKQNITINQYREYEDNYKSIKNKSGKKLSEIKSDKNDSGKSISGTASGKKAHLIMNSKFSTKEKNYMLSKLTNSNSYPTVKELEKLDNDKKIYKYYYSLNSENRKQFIKEINDLNVSSEELYKYYSERREINNRYVSSFAKEKIIDYIQNSNYNEKMKWYLYNKDYGSDTLDLLVNTFNIKSTDYFNTFKYANTIKNKYSNKEDTSIRKQKIFDYINNLSISARQKNILFSQMGYTNSSYKNTMFDYIDSLSISKKEKEKIWKAIY